MKICVKCKQPKSLSEFHYCCSTKDKHQCYCKQCRKEIDKKRKANPIYISYEKQYRQSQKYKISRVLYAQQWRLQYPERQKAEHAVGRAIKKGTLKHPSTLNCYYCPAPAKIYHHHLGYEPEHILDVIPACRRCHAKFHPMAS